MFKKRVKRSFISLVAISMLLGALFGASAGLNSGQDVYAQCPPDCYEPAEWYCPQAQQGQCISFGCGRKSIADPTQICVWAGTGCTQVDCRSI